MKQTIEVEVPDGKTAVWKDGKLVFEDIEPQLPKTWWEFCEQHDIKKGECFINSGSDIMETNTKKREADYDTNLLPSRKAAEQHLALMQLHQLRDCYIQGWKPNYEEDSQKWFIARFENILEINCSIRRNSFLTFQTKKLAEQFLTNFRYLIEKAGDLI